MRWGRQRGRQIDGVQRKPRQCEAIGALTSRTSVVGGPTINAGLGEGMAKLFKGREKPASAKQTYIEPIACPHCGGQAHLMRRTLHPKIKGELWTFECKDCGKQTEKSKL